MIKEAKPPIIVEIIVDSMTQFSIKMTPIHDINFTDSPRQMELEGVSVDIPNDCLSAVRRIFDKHGRVVVRNKEGRKHPYLVIEFTDKLTLLPI